MLGRPLLALALLGSYAHCTSPNPTEPDAGNAADAGSVVDSTTPDAQDSQPDRYYANVPLLIDPSTREESFTAQHIADDSTMVALHFDFYGVPWQEFSTGEELPGAWTDKMDEIGQLVEELELPVSLALTPLHGSRDRLGPAASGESQLVLDHEFGAPCDGAAISEFADAYAAYVRYMVDRFEPTFLALSIEVNLYQDKCPGAWSALETMLNDVYTEQKAASSQRPVFNSFHLDSLWRASEKTDECFGFLTHCLDESLNRIADLKTDYLALSTYPLVPTQNNGYLADNWFSAVAERTTKPLAIAETGYQAETLSVAVSEDDCIDALVTSPADQASWVKRLLEEAETLDMPLVTWWSNHDLMPVATSGACRCTSDADPWCSFLEPIPPDLQVLFRFFGAMGLRDVQGNARPALEEWRAVVRRDLRIYRRPRL